MFPLVGRPSLHWVNSPTSKLLYPLWWNRDRWPQPNRSTWGRQRKPFRIQRKVTVLSCPRCKTNSSTPHGCSLHCPGMCWEALAFHLQIYMDVKIHSSPLFPDPLSKLLFLALLTVRWANRPRLSVTNRRRISMERYHESTCSAADLVLSCLSHRPGWFDIQKQRLCHSSSRGLVLVWVTHVLLDCLKLHGFPHFLTNQVQIPDIRGASPGDWY